MKEPKFRPPLGKGTAARTVASEEPATAIISFPSTHLRAAKSRIRGHTPISDLV